jgi:tetratricopeptide (TPR) repeat protein
MRAAMGPGGLAFALLLAMTALRPAAAIEAGGATAALSARSLAECERGRLATDRTVREEAFARGLEMAERAVELNDGDAAAHFAVFCNKGEMLRLDGEKLSSVFELRAVMRELDRTLALEPGHLKAMASKGILLMRLPRMLGGDAKEGEALLRRVIARDPTAVASRLALAERCRTRGQLDEARTYAGRALEIANERGLVDKVEEAEATLAKIDSAR